MKSMDLVVDASKKYFPDVAGCLDDSRVKVNIGDGLAYMKNHEPWCFRFGDC